MASPSVFPLPFGAQVSELEQELACSHNHSEALERVIKILDAPKVPMDGWSASEWSGSGARAEWSGVEWSGRPVEAFVLCFRGVKRV